jgi:hypothetical protein
LTLPNGRCKYQPDIQLTHISKPRSSDSECAMVASIEAHTSGKRRKSAKISDRPES